MSRFIGREKGWGTFWQNVGALGLVIWAPALAILWHLLSDGGGVFAWVLTSVAAGLLLFTFLSGYVVGRHDEKISSDIRARP